MLLRHVSPQAPPCQYSNLANCALVCSPLFWVAGGIVAVQHFLCLKLSGTCTAANPRNITSLFGPLWPFSTPSCMALCSHFQLQLQIGAISALPEVVLLVHLGSKGRIVEKLILGKTPSRERDKMSLPWVVKTCSSSSLLPMTRAARALSCDRADAKPALFTALLPRRSAAASTE